MNGIPDQRRRVIIGAASVIALAGILYGGWAWWHSRSHVSTDDAYVEGAVAVVSSKVMGNIAELLVQDNQHVKPGDVLLRVDSRDFRAKRDQAAAAVAVAEAAAVSLRAELPMTRGVTAAQGDDARGALEGARAGEAASLAAVEEAKAKVESMRAAADADGAKATANQAVREMDRQKKLVQAGLVALRDYEQAEAAEASSRAAMESTDRRKVQAERAVQQTEAELASKVLGIQQAKQRVAELKGSLARAESQRHQVPMKEADIIRAEA